MFGMRLAIMTLDNGFKGNYWNAYAGVDNNGTE